MTATIKQSSHDCYHKEKSHTKLPEPLFKLYKGEGVAFLSTSTERHQPLVDSANNLKFPQSTEKYQFVFSPLTLEADQN